MELKNKNKKFIEKQKLSDAEYENLIEKQRNLISKLEKDIENKTEKIKTFELKMIQFQNDMTRVKETKGTIDEIIAENIKYKEELKNEAQILIKFVVDKITDVKMQLEGNNNIDIDNLKALKVQGDYTFIANIKGFENLNECIINLVKINKELNIEKSAFKKKCDDLVEKLKRCEIEMSKNLEEKYNNLSEFVKKSIKNKRDILNMYNYISMKKRKK